MEEVVAAVQRRDLREARTLLRQWWIPLKQRYLLTTPTWVIGAPFTLAFQLPLLRRLEQLPPRPDAPRLFMGSWAFWRECSLALWKAEQYDELQRRLAGALRVYNPAVYLVWGRLLARQHYPVSAGVYLLLSGMATAEERDLIARFKHQCQNMHPHQVIAELPRPSRTRRARSLFPEQVYKDFDDVPCPAWWRQRPALP